ncbi:MAG: hypothetical protein KGI35_10235 [Burkholderiales bacterium]|nr:hypothetical protein [Burkholderiales bacterium]
MAVHTPGATAPISTARTLRLRATTRTRVSHGVFSIGGQLGAVYSTRQVGKHHGVLLEIGGTYADRRGDLLALAAPMTPAQARAMAHALTAAAAAIEGGAQ